MIVSGTSNISKDGFFCAYNSRHLLEEWRDFHRKNLEFKRLPYEEYCWINKHQTVNICFTSDFEHCVIANVNDKNVVYGKPVSDTFFGWLRKKFHSLPSTKTYVSASVFDTSVKNNEKKENNNMKMNFEFGSCKNDNFRLSPYGIAVKNNNGEWVSYNDGKIINVDVFNFNGGKYMFKMPIPVQSVAVGDLILHNRFPVYVTNIEGERIDVVDISTGTTQSILPTTNMFNFNFVTKIVSLFNVLSNAPSAESPFGNMLPFFMMDNDNDDWDNDNGINPLLLMAMANGTMDFSNPMMLYLLTQNSGANNDNNMLLAMMMSGMFNNNPAK